MNVCYVDRKGAHSIWRLMNGIAEAVLNSGGRVRYLRLDDQCQRDPIEAPPGVEVTDIAVRPKQYPWHLFTQQNQFCELVDKYIGQNPPDIVHTNFCVPGSATRRHVKQKAGIPVVTTCHELFGSMNLLLRFGVRRTERFADRIVYISRTVAKSYGASLDDSHEPIARRERIIYNGVDTKSIRIAAESADGINPSLIVSVGRLVAEKGHSQVIHAISKLTGDFPALRFRVIGDGPERTNLQTLAKRLGVESHVEFPGWLTHDQAIREMASASLVVMPSRPVQEGFGLALVEAMCCGTRVLASDIPVFREVAGRESPVVSFFRDSDLASLVERLRKVLTDPQFSPDKWRDSFAAVQQRYSSQQMAKEYLAMYSELTS